ncbi:MAG TPA: HAMP domain-containing sensor histidine kinase, partial [Ignavibacteriaceae bacterium]|nr:HAMP domain-containing sensor histidine kinase [Ignavibacteriaceae bacterium]
TTNIEEEIQFENVEDDIDNDNKDNILEDSDKKDFNDEGITINDPDEEVDNNSNLPPVVQENTPVPETQNEDIEEEPLEEIPVEESEPISYEVEDIKELKDSETNIVEQHSFDPSIYYQEILKTIQVIYSKTLLEEVINSIAESCSSLLKTAGAVLYLVDNEKEELTSDILAGNSTSNIRIKFSDGLQGIAAKEKRVVIVDSPHNDENFNPIIEDLTGIKMKNIVFYPILSKSEEPVAVLELYNTERGEFQSPDIEILNTVRPFILQAIDNARISEIFIQRKKMASIGQITNFLNDDIKLPLLNIKHYSSLLKKKFSSKEVNRVLDLQIEQADSIEEFLKSVAAFSNSQNIIEPANVKLSNALNNVLTLLAEYVESRNTVIYKKFSADAQVKLDQKQFFQACYQIAQHACDAMPADGKIYITTETDDNYIKIKFRDTGTGIPESELESIFKPFLSNGKNNPSGIGLSLAEKIISDHGGYLMVDSNVGEGSTFTISLPIIF